ncbi:MAG: sigma-70 family RNA polymerase sigma factor [Planctomycetota bacterium]
MSDAPSSLPSDELLRHAGFLRALVRELVADEHRREDVVQETWLAVLAKPPPQQGRLRFWLATVAGNLARRARRSEQRRSRREAAAAVPEAVPSASQLAERLETLRRLVQAVSALEEPYQSTVLLRFFDDLSVVEIARRSGVPEVTVRTRLRRALAKLRERLDREHGGNRRAWCEALLPALITPKVVAAGVGTGGAAVVSGVLAMALKVKLVLVAGVVVLVGVTVLSWPKGDDGGRAVEEKSRAGQAAVVDGAARQVADSIVVTRPAAMSEPPLRDVALPSPVDLDACDRDLDLFGRAVDEAGEAVAGAEVEAVAYPWRRANVLNYGAVDEAITIARTRTASDGTFAMPLSRGEEVDLRVTAARFARAEVLKCLAGEKVLVVLHGASRLEVVAKDERGEPVDSVKVAAWCRDDRGFSGERRVELTGEDGRAVFDGVRAGKVALSFEHARLGRPESRLVTVGGRGTTVFEITLRPGRTIGGRVTDAMTGEPIQGARVGENWVLDRSVITDADGHFILQGWTSHSGTELHVVAEGYGRQGMRVPPEGELDFELWSGDELVGRVMGTKGDAVPGVLVCAIGSQSRTGVQEIDTVSTRAGAGGSFHLSGVRRDMPHTLVLQASGFGRLLLDVDPHPVEPGVIDLGDIVMPEGRSIEGVVLNAEGGIMPYAIVELLGHDEGRGRLRPNAMEPAYTHEGYGQEEMRRTDDLGRFRFPDLSPGRYQLWLLTSGIPSVAPPPLSLTLMSGVRRRCGRRESGPLPCRHSRACFPASRHRPPISSSGRSAVQGGNPSRSRCWIRTAFR